MEGPNGRRGIKSSLKLTMNLKFIPTKFEIHFLTYYITMNNVDYLYL